MIAACGASAGPGAEGPGGVGGDGPAFMHATDDPVAQEMRRVAARMGEAGLVLGPIHGSGFLTTREQRTEAIDVPAGMCATIVAIAARGIRDIDATLFAPAGDVLAEDIEPDAHPTLQVCGGEEGRRLYYGIHAYDGAGTFLYASFVGERESFEAAARVMGGRPGVVSEGDGRGDQDVRLRELATGVARRGFRAHGDPIAVPLAADQRVRLPLSTERGHCYTVAAFSMPGLDDVDLRVLDELDGELATDTTSASDATAQLCAERDAVLAVELHAKRGEGEARVAFFRAGDSSVGGSSGLWLGERTDALVATVPLDEAVQSALEGARARGWRSPNRRASGRLVPGEAVAHPVRLGRGCALVVASGGRGIGKLLLRIVGPDGALLADPVANGATARAHVCVDAGAEVRAQIVARRGGGDYALHVLTGGAGAGEVPAPARGGVLRALEEANGTEWTIARGPDRLTLDASGATRIPVDLEARSCVEVHVGASTPVTIEVRRDEAVEARAHGLARAVLVCPREAAATPAVHVHGPPRSDVWITILRRTQVRDGE